MQLKIDFETEYSPEWIKPKRYDFYFDGIIVEMDGGLGHGNYNSLNNMSGEDSKSIDNYKDKMAIEHGIQTQRNS